MLEFMNMKNNFLFPLVLALSGAALSTRAEVTLHPLFADNSVLQQGMKVPIWGTSQPREHIVIDFAGQSVMTDAGPDGKWKAYLKPMKAAGPYVMTVTGVNTIRLTNVMVGEVWIASGQSNMERHLGLQSGQKPILGWQDEVRDANYPDIRQFYVVKKTAMAPQTTVKGDWSICSPDTVTNFTAVGYFFARDVHRARHVAVGLIHSSWGGTPAEAWTSEDGLHGMADSSGPLGDLARYKADPERGKREYEAKLDAWYQVNDLGSTTDKPWNGREVDLTKWSVMSLPVYWESAGQ